MKEPRLEVCAGSIGSVKAAAKGGAFRVELCSALSEGGITPSIGFVHEAVKAGGVKVNVLIRPRGGDFIYTPEEVDCMCHDIRAIRNEGADGVVIGALLPDGDIDAEACRRMISEAEGMSVTFHRAFDLCRDMDTAMQQIIALGCDTLLTSGQHPSALEGCDSLRYLNEKYGDKITIMAGSGVASGNAADIVARTGCTTLHASARKSIPSAMQFRHPSVKMGSPDSDEYSRLETSAEEVAAIIAAIRRSASNLITPES